MNCPYCGGTNFKKAGKLKSGKQRYVCKDCNKGFSSFEQVQKQPLNIECIFCNGHNIVKAGKTTHNKQVYLCKDCNKKFSENKLEIQNITQTCPYCGGHIAPKGWSNNGTARRYICKTCKKGFTGDLNNLQVKIIDKPCPYCGSENVRKGGKLRSGVKRYRCNDCGKGFNTNTPVVPPEDAIPEKCPKCGHTIINKCGKDTKTGKQRYICKSCNYKFVKNPTQHKFHIWQKECPVCGHIGAKKAGKSYGKQYYLCLQCNHKYLEGGKYTKTTKQQLEQILQLYRQGTVMERIAELTGRTLKTIQSQVSKYKTEQDDIERENNKNKLLQKLVLNGFNLGTLCGKFNKTKKDIEHIMAPAYKTENISQQQYNDIIKFGVCCAVPVNYLAPYIKCSEYACNKIISKYNINKNKKIVLTEQQLAQDRMELEKFVGK